MKDPIKNRKNLFSNIPKTLPEELIQTLATKETVRIERIVSKGHFTKKGFWYDQEQNEWVVLLKGKAIVFFDNDLKEIELHPGDYINILPHVRHRVEWTDPNEETVWLAVHY